MGARSLILFMTSQSDDMTWSPEVLDTQVPDKQCAVQFQFFTSLLRRGGGWFANHALNPSRNTV
jgi:hypothetical protein